MATGTGPPRAGSSTSLNRTVWEKPGSDYSPPASPALRPDSPVVPAHRPDGQHSLTRLRSPMARSEARRGCRTVVALTGA